MAGKSVCLVFSQHQVPIEYQAARVECFSGLGGM